jgi:hypothetical protein
VRTIAAVQDQIKWGLPPDCDTNPICKGALETYGITYPPKSRTKLAACDAPIAQALQAKTIDLAELCSTQPAIAQFGFVQLTDDKQTAGEHRALVRDDFPGKTRQTAFRSLVTPAKMHTAPHPNGVTSRWTTRTSPCRDWLTKKQLRNDRP